ncbi:MAG: ADP-dependent glucokinase/phosphofructokinase [Candidatus Nezhaarchaeales archaeon]
MNLTYGEYRDYWINLMKEAVQHAHQCIRNIKGIVTAFNTNIDAVKTLREGDIERLAAKIAISLGDDIEIEIEEISEVKHLLKGLLKAIRTGNGFELSISKPEVSTWISTNIKADEVRMGGQAGISANVLAALGVENVYVHVASIPRVQAELFKDHGVLIPCRRNDAIFAAPPLTAYNDQHEPMIHWVFEFHEGYTIKLNGFYARAPKSDRFIASYDPLNSSLHIDPIFEEFMRSKAVDVDKALISGFQLLKPRYPDGSTFKDKVLKAKNIIEEWKSINQNMWIHLEQAYMTNAEILRFVVEELTKKVDSYGLNEVELDILVKTMDLIDEAGEVSLMDKLILIAKTLKLKCLVLHTRDFAVALTKGNVDLEGVKKALWFGSMLAAARTLTGCEMAISEMMKVLREHPLPVSLESYKYHMQLSNALNIKALKTLREGFEYQGYNIVLAPALSNTRPVRSVGLGDTFTSGFLVCTPLASPR